MGIFYYIKIENGHVELLDKLSKFYGITIDEIVHMDNEVQVPTDITLEDKTTSEQMRLIVELDEKDKFIAFGMIETMLTKKKLKDFFNKKWLHYIKAKKSCQLAGLDS